MLRTLRSKPYRSVVQRNRVRQVVNAKRYVNTPEPVQFSDVEKMKRMLKYRSMERGTCRKERVGNLVTGMIENELILRQFYAKHVVNFNQTQLEEYKRFLDEPDPFVYKWLTKAVPFPDNYSKELTTSLTDFMEKEFDKRKTKEY